MSYYGRNSSYFQYSCKYIQCTLVTYLASCSYTLYLHCAFVVTGNHMTKALIVTVFSILSLGLALQKSNMEATPHLVTLSFPTFNG